MKTIIVSTVLAFILALTPAHASQTVKLVTDADFAPYSMFVEGKPAGIDVEVMTEAAKRAGISLDIELQPWDVLVDMVKKGTCDGAFSLFKTPERERYAMFAEALPVHTSDYVLFTKVNSKFSFRTYDDLKGKNIGRVAGIDLGEEFEAAGAQGGMVIKDFPDLSSAMRALLVGDIDAYAGNIDVTYYRLNAMGMANSIVYLPKKLMSLQPAYLVMSRASTFEDKDRIIQGLERALDQMRRDGTYNKIAKRYLFRF